MLNKIFIFILFINKIILENYYKRGKKVTLLEFITMKQICVYMYMMLILAFQQKSEIFSRNIPFYLSF